MRTSIPPADAPTGDDDPYSTEYQRLHKIGPDYDPDYSAKLEAMLLEEFGPLGDMEIVDG